MSDTQLLPCPFCGHDTPEFERMGTSGQSCIVICGDCGARHESSDEYQRSGQSWNTRAALAHPGQAAPAGEVASECNLPPIGWQCTRGAGHEGPCAAVKNTTGPSDWPLAEARRYAQGYADGVKDALAPATEPAAPGYVSEVKRIKRWLQTTIDTNSRDLDDWRSDITDAIDMCEALAAASTPKPKESQ